MKRSLIFMLALLLAVALTACGHEPSPTVFEKNGYTVDLEAGTITKGEDIYTFTVTGNGSQSEIHITYPSGATYFWVWQGNGGHGGWSDDYDPVHYVDGEILMELVSFEPPPEEHSGNLVAGLLLIVLGLADAIFPHITWYLSYGWRYKNAEPSDAALIFGRMGGCAAIFIGILLLVL